MRIQDLVHKSATAGKWKSTTEPDYRSEDFRPCRKVYHYSTLMLQFRIGEDGEWDRDEDSLYCYLGHGSMSDQNGMNILFAAMAASWAYYRQGGARIEATQLPHYRYGITPQKLYDSLIHNATVQEVIETWPVKIVEA